MLESISFDSLANALSEAVRVGAIDSNGLTVPASAPEARLMAHFRFATEQIYRGDGRVIDDGTVPRLRITIIAPERPGEFGLPHFDVRWDPETPAEDVGAQLETLMRQRDRLVDAKALDFPLALRELQRGLRLALTINMHRGGEEKLHSKLREVIGDDWAITNVGLQNLTQGWAWTWDELGIVSLQNPISKSTRPEAPEGIDEAEWAFVYARVDDQRPRGLPYGLMG